MLAFFACLLASLLVQELVACALTNQGYIRCKTNTNVLSYLSSFPRAFNNRFSSSSSDWFVTLVTSEVNGSLATLELV